MSRKGNCWDNAVAESFFKTIKVEELYHHKFKSIEQVYSVVFDYIDGWYNTLRIHSTLGGISPRQMAQILAALVYCFLGRDIISLLMVNYTVF
jgi:putative transposase